MSNGLLCRWDGSDYRCQTASASTYGLAGDVMISGNQEADLTALGGGDATVNSADGDVNVFSGGALTVGVQAQTGIQAGSNGTLSINGTTATGDIQVVSVGNLSGSLTATTGSVTALSVAGESATVDAGNDATVFGGITLGGGVNAGHNVQAVSYGSIAALPGISAGNDLWVFGVGNVTGVYSAGDAVQFFGSDGSIQADITAQGSGNGTVCVVTAWGNIGGSITAASSIAGVDAGGTVSASLSAPTIGTITQNDTGLIGTRPVLGDVGQAGLAAAVKGLVAQGQQIQSQLSQEAAAIQQQNSVAQDQAQQTYQMVVSEFATALSQANSALTSADSAATATLSQAKAADQAALGKANAQINAIVNQITTQAAAQQASDDLSLTQTQQAVSIAQQDLGVVISTASQRKSNLQSGAATDLANQLQKMAAGKAQHERDWKSAILKILRVTDSEKANAAQGTYFGYTASQWWNIAQGAALGAAQGVVNDINGLQDAVIGMANFGITISGLGPIAGAFGWNLSIPSPDWSNGLIVTESQSAHNISKFLGGQGLTELLTFGASTLAESGVICKLTGWGCFVAGTEVVTGQNSNGTFSETPIQDIQVGDYVLSRNQYDPNGPLQEEQVTAVEQHTVFSLQNVTVKGADGKTEVIQATPNHPFYVEGEGWTPSGELQAGDELEEPDGSYATVVSSVGDPQSQGVTVYNFTVANDHTYFVDQGGAVVWVHNILDCTALGQEGEELANIVKNTEHIESLTETANYRIPDILNHVEQVVGDVKNVGTLSFTRQIQDLLYYSLANGYDFTIITRVSTELSGPLQALEDAGLVAIQRLLP